MPPKTPPCAFCSICKNISILGKDGKTICTVNHPKICDDPIEENLEMESESESESETFENETKDSVEKDSGFGRVTHLSPFFEANSSQFHSESYGIPLTKCLCKYLFSLNNTKEIQTITDLYSRCSELREKEPSEEFLPKDEVFLVENTELQGSVIKKLKINIEVQLNNGETKKLKPFQISNYAAPMIQFEFNDPEDFEHELKSSTEPLLIQTQDEFADLYRQLNHSERWIVLKEIDQIYKQLVIQKAKEYENCLVSFTVPESNETLTGKVMTIPKSIGQKYLKVQVQKNGKTFLADVPPNCVVSSKRIFPPSRIRDSPSSLPPQKAISKHTKETTLPFVLRTKSEEEHHQKVMLNFMQLLDKYRISYNKSDLI
jgi:hypothetical protein